MQSLFSINCEKSKQVIYHYSKNKKCPPLITNKYKTTWAY